MAKGMNAAPKLYCIRDRAAKWPWRLGLHLAFQVRGETSAPLAASKKVDLRDMNETVACANLL